MKKTGIDIISKRMTELEKGAIRVALGLPKGSICLDLGAGEGWLGIILAFLHQKVYFIDQKINWKIKVLKKVFRFKNMILIQKDVRKMNYADFPDNISLVYSSRFLHYLQYEEAEKLLRILQRKIISKQGLLIFSISGIDSELGQNYLGKDSDIKNRFDYLSSENQKKFQIKEKITLYSQKEAENLFSQYFQIQKIWQSDFGNVFVIAIMKS